jgi:predicted nucleotidyltransferase
MIDIETLKQIIISWAPTLPYKVRIHLFGSYLRGKKTSSDIDISIELLHSLSKKERTEIWFDYQPGWEKYLCEASGSKIHLCLFEGDDSPNLKTYLQEASLLVYDSMEMGT